MWVAIERLKGRFHVFVLDGAAVNGIVTAADLGRPVVSMLVLAMILSWEEALDWWVEATSVDWQRYLTQNQLEQAHRVLKSRTEHDTVGRFRDWS